MVGDYTVVSDGGKEALFIIQSILPFIESLLTQPVKWAPLEDLYV